MHDIIYDYLNHFDRSEAWGDPDKMNPWILSAVDIVRHMADWPFVVHFGIQGNHKVGSRHPKGMAIDGHFVTDTVLYFQALAILKILKVIGLDQKMGIGLYPTWDSPGFHFDRRTKGGKWGRIHGEYVSWSTALDYAQEMQDTTRDNPWAKGYGEI